MPLDWRENAKQALANKRAAEAVAKAEHIRVATQEHLIGSQAVLEPYFGKVPADQLEPADVQGNGGIPYWWVYRPDNTWEFYVRPVSYASGTKLGGLTVKKAICPRCGANVYPYNAAVEDELTLGGLIEQYDKHVTNCNKEGV